MLNFVVLLFHLIPNQNFFVRLFDLPTLTSATLSGSRLIVASARQANSGFRFTVGLGVHWWKGLTLVYMMASVFSVMSCPLNLTLNCFLLFHKILSNLYFVCFRVDKYDLIDFCVRIMFYIWLISCFFFQVSSTPKVLKIVNFLDNFLVCFITFAYVMDFLKKDMYSDGMEANVLFRQSKRRLQYVWWLITWRTWSTGLDRVWRYGS